MAANLTEGGAGERNLLTIRWDVYSKERLVMEKTIQPTIVVNNIKTSVPRYYLRATLDHLITIRGLGHVIPFFAVLLEA
jgi:hypothetical protein